MRLANKKYQCDCGEEFKSKKELSSHKKKAHPKKA